MFWEFIKEYRWEFQIKDSMTKKNNKNELHLELRCGPMMIENTITVLENHF